MLCYIYCSVLFNFVVFCSVLLHLATPACWTSLRLTSLCQVFPESPGNEFPQNLCKSLRTPLRPYS